ncbi:hypothetical protein BV11031_07570 [Bacillus vallismortis]|nr:hypothetical protein BV11031_07570 [Bacillus vallismortis]
MSLKLVENSYTDEEAAIRATRSLVQGFTVFITKEAFERKRIFQKAAIFNSDVFVRIINRQ